MTLIVVVAIAIAFYYFTGFYTDYLWFDQLGFAQILQVRWLSILVMFLIGFVAMAVPLWAVMQVAFRTRPMYAQLSSQLDRYQELIEPLRRFGMVAIPVLFGLFSGVAASSRWETAQLWLHRQDFGQSDPQFGLDVGFYVFEVPFYQQVLGFAQLVLFACFAATVAIAYLYGSLRISGRDFRVARTTRIMMAVIAALFMLALAVNVWLNQYAALSQPGSGTVRAGAGFASVNASIPGIQILAVSAALVAVAFVVTAIIGRWRISIIGTAVLVVLSLIVGIAYPAIIQRFQVDPSARTLEAEYIDRNIQSTREAYGVADVNMQPTDTRTDTEAGQLAEDAQTTANIRIMDPAMVSGAFQNLQSFRQYYEFPDQLNVDRYEIDGEVVDTVVAVRELNVEQLGNEESWYNQHVVYTHGYGVVAAYGNQRGPEGQPVFMQGGVPTTGDLGEYEPRIYFGESTPAYSIVGAPEGEDDRELDYPRSEEEGAGNAYTTFDGEGGPSIGNLFNRLAYALQFQSEQILLSDAVNEESQILYNRDPVERVQAVAPYLTLDQTSYPAVVDGRVVWIVDGFTTTNAYPYSSQINMSSAIADTTNPNPTGGPAEGINYIRNSVKAVVDAYDGSVTLYAWDTEDPMLKAWTSVYPTSVTPMEEMSGDLLSHVRYPQDLFKVQRFILGEYHVTDPGTFYSGDDQWRTPSEPTWGSDNANPAPAQPPYYLTMSVGESDPAFTLYSTYIPSGSQAPNVLYGYLSVNADAGSTPGEVSESYGQLTLQQLPKDQSVPGPGQMQNNFNTDNAISVELNILERGATEVMRGNLLTVPVGGGLLYVQPVYLRSTGSTSFPVLRKILVAFGDDIAFADTLDEALDILFEGDSGAVAGDEGQNVDSDGDGTDGDGDGDTTPETPENEEQATLQQQLDQALRDAKAAMDERAAAYADNDLVAAAEADAKLQTALEKAIVLSDQIAEAQGETPADEQ